MNGFRDWFEPANAGRKELNTPMLAEYILSIQIDLEEARDFYSEGDYPKVKANLQNLRDTANKALELPPFQPIETPETQEGQNHDG